MKRTKIILFAVLVACFAAAGALAQDANIVKKDLSQAEIDRIVKAFTAKEGEFTNALQSYVYRRKAVIQTIGFGGQITGVYRRDSFMNLTPDGTRFEKILFAPMPTLTEISITPQDLEDLYGEFTDILKRLRDEKGLSAAVYTEITDVEIESNGLMKWSFSLISSLGVLPMIS